MYTEKILLAKKREYSMEEALKVTDSVSLLNTGLTDGRTWVEVSFHKPKDLFELGIAYMSFAAQKEVEKLMRVQLN